MSESCETLTYGGSLLIARPRSYRDAFVNDFDHGQVACENASPEPHSKSQHDSETHAQDNAQLQGEEEERAISMGR